MPATKFITLGTAGGPTPKPHRMPPAHAVVYDGGTILVDCGEGSFQQLRRAGIDFKRVRELFITHHHFDHIGGNKDLKEKFGSIIVGFKGDANRIPEMDILLEDEQIWKAENFVAKIMHIPGHTTGHISFHFFQEKLVFTGDTLFSWLWKNI